MTADPKKPSEKTVLSDSEILHQPLILKNKTTIKNRFFKSAMSEVLGGKKNQPTKTLIQLYSRWAKGGAGVLISGNVMIDSRYLGEYGNVVIENENGMELLKKWACAGTQNNTSFWVQLNHPGKQISKTLCKEPVAPSAVPLRAGLEKLFNLPRELSPAEIEEIIERFARSALIVKKAGFSGVQIHAAHGYLISQFLSPVHNIRTDKWGGSAENRRRFLVEVIGAIRNKVGTDFPVSVKLNSADFSKGGFSEDESIDVIKTLSQLDVDLLEISGGSYEAPAMTGVKQKESTLKREAYFLEFAKKARNFAAMPLVLTGGFRTSKGMAEALRSNAVDMIGLARPLAVDPDLPEKILKSNEIYESKIKIVKTGVKAVDRSGILEIIWYERQLRRIGKGKNPKNDMSVWMTLILYLLSNGIDSLKKRRA